MIPVDVNTSCNMSYSPTMDACILFGISSLSYTTTLTKKKPDYIICALDGTEVGCGEIKAINVTQEEAQEDCCRVPEHLKKQLHQRMITATSEVELITFGFIISGEDVELTTMEYKDGRYLYSTIKTIKMPTMTTTYISMEDSLEFLLSFFTMIDKSVVDHTEGSPLLPRLKSILKPTLHITYLNKLVFIFPILKRASQLIAKKVI